VGREAHELHGLDAPHPAVPIPLLFCFFSSPFREQSPSQTVHATKQANKQKSLITSNNTQKKNEGEATAGTKEKT
jgi:hypothetical protein